METREEHSKLRNVCFKNLRHNIGCLFYRASTRVIVNSTQTSALNHERLSQSKTTSQPVHDTVIKHSIFETQSPLSCRSGVLLDNILYEEQSARLSIPDHDLSSFYPFPEAPCSSRSHIRPNFLIKIAGHRSARSLPYITRTKDASSVKKHEKSHHLHGISCSPLLMQLAIKQLCKMTLQKQCT